MIGKRQLFLVGDVPANKFLRLSIRRHWNFFLLTLKAELLGFAFDYGRVILQVIDLLLQIEILGRQFFNFLIEAFVLLGLTVELRKSSKIYCQTKDKGK